MFIHRIGCFARSYQVRYWGIGISLGSSHVRVTGGVGLVEAFGRILGGAGNSGRMWKLERFVSTLGVFYATGWVFVKWHGLFVDG